MAAFLKRSIGGYSYVNVQISLYDLLAGDRYDLLLEFKHVPLKALKVGNHKLTGQEVQAKSRSELVNLSAVKKELTQAKAQLRDP